MRRFAFLLATLALAQAPGVVTITGNVTAVAGIVTCIGTPGTVAGTVKATCTVSGSLVIDATITPQPSPMAGSSIAVASGSDNVTAIFTKTGSTINWSVAANGVTKTGSF